MKIKIRTVRKTLFRKLMKLGWKNLWKAKHSTKHLKREPIVEDEFNDRKQKFQQTHFRRNLED
jgi:hypothetical protein